MSPSIRTVDPVRHLPVNAGRLASRSASHLDVELSNRFGDRFDSALDIWLPCIEQPITLGIYRYIGNNNQEWNAIMATAVVASIPAAVLLVVAQRYVAAGVTAGAVKD